MSALSLLARRLAQLAHQQQPTSAGALWQLAGTLASQCRPQQTAVLSTPAYRQGQATGARAYGSRSSKGAAQPALHSLTRAYVEQVLEKLQISSGGLSKLLAASDTSDEDVISWTLARLEEHPAQQLAAPLTAQLRSLRGIVTARHAWQQHEVTHVMLLKQVASAAETDRLRALTAQQLRALPEYPYAAAAAAASGRDSSAGQEDGARTVLIHAAADGQLQLSPLETLRLPDFWERAAQAVAAAAEFAQVDVELKALGFAEAAKHAQQRSQLLADLLKHGQQGQVEAGTRTAAEAEATHAEASTSSSSSTTGDTGSSSKRSKRGYNTASAATSQLEALLVQQLGCSNDSSNELMQRLLGRVRPLSGVDGALSTAVAAALPALTAALLAMPQRIAASASWQDVLAASQQHQEGHEAGPVQALATELQRWRAAAAAADGSVAVASTLTRAEVHALSEPQFKAVAAHIQAWEARGRLLVDAYLSGAGPDPAALSATDGDALAWRLHKEPGLASALVAALLQAAASAQGATVVSNDEERDALKDAEAGFMVEQEVARLSPYGRPELLLSGALSEDLPDMLKGVRPPGAARVAAAVPKQPPPARIAADLAAWLNREGAPLGQAPPPQWKEAVERLAPSRQKLPSSLRGMFDELLATDAPAMGDAAAYANFQSKVLAFLSALDNEMGSDAAAASAVRGGAGGGPAAGVPDGGQQALHWRLGLGSALSARPSKGLTELLGEEEASQMMLRFENSVEQQPWRGRARDDDEGPGLQPYEMLGELHHGMHMQRYLNAEFDPDRQLDLVHPPTGWREPALFESPAVFLEGMRPLLEAHLTSQGERGLHDSEWQLYSSAALAEYEAFEDTQANAARRAGRSGFHNSRADEAYLKQRLENGMPANSPLRAAAGKYLAAACQNPSWSFAQRQHLVDRLLEIAAHLASNPARTQRGSPFSALFSQNGPPLVPRLARRPVGKGRGGGGGRARAEFAQLPAGFGAGRRAGQRAAEQQQVAATAGG